MSSSSTKLLNLGSAETKDAFLLNSYFSLLEAPELENDQKDARVLLL